MAKQKKKDKIYLPVNFPELTDYKDLGGVLKDIGKTGLNMAAMPFEIAAGQNFYDPKMDTDLGVGMAKVQNTLGQVGTAIAPTALNMVAPGLGTALNATQAIGSQVIKDDTKKGNSFNNQTQDVITGTVGAAANLAPMFMGQFGQGNMGATQFGGGGDLHYGTAPYEDQLKLYNYRKKYNETHAKYTGGDDPNMINKFTLDQTPEGQAMWKLAQKYGAAFISDPNRPTYGKDVTYSAYENPMPKMPAAATPATATTPATPAQPIDPNWKYQAPKFTGFKNASNEVPGYDAYGDNSKVLPPVYPEGYVKKAMGGPLDMTEYNGNTHENGGIPLGKTGSEVEGGETRVGDYIFSDRLTPKGMDKTFAQLAKKINNKYIRENDPASERSKARELQSLMQANEMVRQEAEATEASLMMKLGGYLKYDNGGIFIDPSKRGIFTKAAKQRNMGIQEFASQVMAYGGKMKKYYSGGIYDPAKPDLMYTVDTQGLPIDSRFGVPNTQLPNYNESPFLPIDDYRAPMKSIQSYQNSGITLPEILDTKSVSQGNPYNTQGDNQQKQNNFFDPNAKFGAKEVGLLASNLGAGYNLVKGMTKPEETKFERFTPEEISLQAQRDAVAKQVALAKQMNASNVRGNATSSGQALSNLAAGNSALTANQIDNTLASYAQEKNTNAGIRNQAGQMNTNIANQEIIANEQNKAMQQSLLGMGLSNVGANTQGYMRDKGMQQANTKYNAQTMSIINQMFPHYKWNVNPEQDQYMIQFANTQLNNQGNNLPPVR